MIKDVDESLVFEGCCNSLLILQLLIDLELLDVFALLNQNPYFVVRWQGAHQLDFDCQPNRGGHGAMRDRWGKRDSHYFIPDRDVLQRDDLQLLQR